MLTPDTSEGTMAEARAFTPDDAEALEGLARESYGDALGDSEELLRAAGLIAKAPDNIAPMVELVGNQLAAYAAVFAEPWMYGAKRRRIHLLARETSVGRLLLATLLDRLREGEVTSVEVRVPVNSPRAESLLSEFGFSVLRQDVLMEMDVRNASQCEVAESTHDVPAGVVLAPLEAELDRNPHAMAQLHALWITLAGEDPAHDPAGDPPLAAFDGWMRSPASMLGGCYLAAVGERYVGVTLLRRVADNPRSLMQNLTGVLLEHRRKGIAIALKRAAIGFAARSGFQSLRTWVAGSNNAIRSLNTRLGYRERLVLNVFEKKLSA